MKKLLLLLTLFSVIATTAQIPSYVPSTGLVGWWPFSGNANDMSGNGYNGKVVGATLTKDRFGKIDSAYSFNGSSDTIYTPYVQTNITAFSISAWFKTSLGGPIIAGDYNTHCITLDVGKMPYDGINTGKVCIRCDGPAIDIGQISNRTYLDSAWHHVAAIYNGAAGSISSGQFQLYVDDSLIMSTANNVGSASAPLNNSLPVIFGAHYIWSDSAIFNGTLDDIGIWNRALTPQEVKSLYRGDTTLTGMAAITSNNEAISIYPNPTNGKLLIQSPALNNRASVEIYDVMGKKVYSSILTNQSSAIYIDVPNGVYFLKTSTENGTVTEKLIINK